MTLDFKGRKKVLLVPVPYLRKAHVIVDSLRWTSRFMESHKDAYPLKTSLNSQEVLKNNLFFETHKSKRQLFQCKACLFMLYGSPGI